MTVLVRNPTIDIQVTEPETGVNAFWIAAFYGHGGVMKVLAEKGIDIFNHNKITGSNALHISTQKNFTNVVQMLVRSKFYLEIPRKDGLTALGIACLKKESYPIVRILLKAGANPN